MTKYQFIDPSGGDDTVNLQAAIDLVGQDGLVEMAAGQLYQISGNGLSVPYHGFYLRPNGATLRFTATSGTPVAPSKAVTFDRGDGTILYGGGIDGRLKFSAAASGVAYSKIALDLGMVSRFDSGQLIEITGETNVPNIGTMWSGNGSVGVRIGGNEWNTLGRLFCYADNPIQIRPNPYQGVDLSHWHFHDHNLVANTAYPIIRVQPGVVATNWLYDGQNAWVHGSCGLEWVGTSSVQAVSHNLRFANIRSENGDSAAGFTFDIQHYYGIQELMIENSRLDQLRNGIRLRKVEGAAIRNTRYLGNQAALDVDATSFNGLVLDNYRYGSGSSFVVNGASVNPIFATTPLSVGGPPPFAIFNAPGATVGNIVSGGALTGPKLPMADGTVAMFAPAAATGTFTIYDNESLYAVIGLRGLQPYVDLLHNPTGYYTANDPNAPGKTNIYWNGTTQRYEFKNNRGPRNYAITRTATETSLS